MRRALKCKIYKTVLRTVLLQNTLQRQKVGRQKSCRRVTRINNIIKKHENCNKDLNFKKLTVGEDGGPGQQSG